MKSIWPFLAGFGFDFGPVLSRILLLLCICTLSTTGSSINNSTVHNTQLSLSTTVNIPVAEWNALYDLYNATNGPDWQWSDIPSQGIVWNFSSYSLNNPCVDQWQGISCNITSPLQYYHISSIELPSYNLVGTLPSTLNAFVSLQQMNLDSNQLAGPIPESLDSLMELQILYLNFNLLSGPIPTSLGSLNKLQGLDLSSNHLTGPIPESLGSLTQLRILNLHANLLSGPIPS